MTDDPDLFPEKEIKIEDLNVLGTVTVTSGRLELHRVAAKKVSVYTADIEDPVLDAHDCLFDYIEAPRGLVRLEHCTVRRYVDCRRLQASDCIFAGEVDVFVQNGDPPGCVRFSRLWGINSRVPVHATTSDKPVFFEIGFCDSTGTPQRAKEFGQPGYGCLHPATPDSICFGAEDGGEMGADHHRALCLARAAVAAKLEEFLPVGLEAVLIPDDRLLVAPPPLRDETRSRR